MKTTIDLVPLEEIESARARLTGVVVRTPLVALTPPGEHPQILLKLENLQPIGAFKVRGAMNAILTAGDDALADGVTTASAGNMAQAVAWAARRLGIACRVLVPDTAPRAKIDPIERLGAEIVRVTFDGWWQAMVDHGYPGMRGHFIHPFADRAVLAGNGTIGLEIIEDAQAVDAIIVPYGGGGLSCGIASAVGATRPEVRVYAAEVETSAQLAPALRAGGPVGTTPTPTFVDGIGGRGVFPEIWPLARDLLAGSLVATLAEVAEGVRLLAERGRVIAEGAGAASLAAAIHHAPPEAETIVCVVSGGNIDRDILAAILRGEILTKEH